MASKPRVLLPLVEFFKDLFLTDADLDQLAEFSDMRLVLCKWGDSTGWDALLAEFKPDVLVTGWGTPRLTLESHEKTPSVKFIAHLSGAIRGVVDKSVMEKHGVRVTNWGEIGTPSIAEGTLMMTLASLRKFPYYHNLMHVKKGWGAMPARGQRLFKKRVGIQGLGRISRHFVKLLEPFGCDIMAYSPHVKDEIFKEYNVKRCNSLEELHSQNEVVVNLAGLTPQTRGCVTREIIKLLPDGAHYILTGRAGTVDMDAMREELMSGRIFGAFDVYDAEPLPEDSPLRGLENCILFPHVAGPTTDYYPEIVDQAFDNIRRFFANAPLVNEVTPDLYDFMT